jgi:hypothetical protein
LSALEVRFVQISSVSMQEPFVSRYLAVLYQLVIG